jgi:sirohydrochlorin ferrochelatase
VAEVDAALAADGLTRDEVMAGALALKIDEVERIDRMVAGAEARLNVALREIYRHRATLAALRQAVDEALDAEFKAIPPRLTEGEAGRDERP